MALSFLPSTSTLSTGLQLRSARYVNGLFTTVTPEFLQSTLDTLASTIPGITIHLDVTALPSTDDVLALLDAGAAKVIVSMSQLMELESVKDLAQDRLVLRIAGASTKGEIVDAIGGKSVGVLAHVKDASLVEAWLDEYGADDRPPVYVSFVQPVVEDVLKVAALGGVPVVPAGMVSLDSANVVTGGVSAAKILVAGAVSDRPDGLFTTMVTDERGVALGLVYSSEKSIDESLRLGRGVYQSRKRGLWYKGASSGDIQELVKIGWDCDKDCLVFVVRQSGRGMEVRAQGISYFMAD
jgi:phosphoribosyl-ATP pyrophosphohydrolase / phosphoribosyl-AMP cyclohydrolase / histidinol dehydrogenase